MVNNLRISLCMPCRNEAKHLPEVVNGIPDFIDEVLIISNNSTDDTVAVGQAIGGRVKTLQDDRTLGGIGYGFAHMTGIANATGDLIAAADADGTYPVEEFERIVPYMIENDLNFVSCNRYPLKDGTRIPFKLRMGVGMLNWEIRLLYGIPIKDSLSGMWVFRRSIADKLHLTMGDWNLSPQIKINAARNKEIKFSEYNIIQRARLGETKQNYLTTGYSHAKWILANRFRRSGM